jgi:hypothetical protein
LNKLPKPAFNDQAAFEDLANNDNLNCYPHLMGLISSVKTNYFVYELVDGNPFHIFKQAIPGNISDIFEHYYKNPNKDLKHIKELRRSKEHLTCPMCGSKHRGTLDHYLPQSSYPIFCLYSKNLVPACKCNSLRNDKLMGTSPGERVLHPYFDNCLSQRLVKAKFEDIGEVPRIVVELSVDETHPEYSAIKYHFENIVKKTAVVGYLGNLWSKLCQKPSLVIREFRHNITDRNQLRQILLEERGIVDELHDGKNNWDSIFISGLLDPEAIDWLVTQFSDAARAPDGPLA